MLFDAVFLIIAILVVCMYKRENDKWEIIGIKDVIRGGVLGVLFSTIMSAIGISIELTFGMLLLIPLTVLLTSINPKWGCYAYVIPFAYVLGSIIEIFGYNITWLDLPYTDFITLIGFLHLVEGILVILYGGENTIDVPVYDGKNITTGYLMKKFWPVPLVIFAGGTPENPVIIPLYAILGYIDVARSYQPKIKSIIMGRVILLYGISVILLGILALKGLISMPFALALMPIGHELMFVINYLPHWTGYAEYDI